MKPLISRLFCAAAIFGILGCAIAPAAPNTDETIDKLFAELPPFFHDQAPGESNASGGISFNPRLTLELVAALQKLGQSQTIVKLRELAKRPDGGNVIPLCRMLFVARPGGKFRAPALGMSANLPRADGGPWPLEPLAIVNGIPFLITMGYSLAGLPEQARDYLEYCIAECDWNTRKYIPLYYNTMRHGSIGALLNAACARLLSINAPMGKWHDGHWTQFMQAQTKSWNRFLDIIPADFSSRKSTLQNLLDTKFNLASVPGEHESDFYKIIEAFIQYEYYRGDMFITRIQFTSPSTAVLYYVDGHTSGHVELKKKNDSWGIMEMWQIA